MKIKNNIVIDGTIQHEDGGSSNEYFATDGTRQTINNVSFVADVASLPATGVVDTLYIAKAENTLHEWNGSSYDSLGDNEVEVYPDVANLPATGRLGVVYIAEAENSLHKWNGSTYDQLGGSTQTIVSTDSNNNITAGGDGGAYLDTSGFVTRPQAKELVNPHFFAEFQLKGEVQADFSDLTTVMNGASMGVVYVDKTTWLDFRLVISTSLTTRYNPIGSDFYVQLTVNPNGLPTDSLCILNSVVTDTTEGTFTLFQQSAGSSSQGRTAVLALDANAACVGIANRRSVPESGGSSNVVFVANQAALPATGVVDTLYVATSENTLHEWNGSSYDSVGVDVARFENVGDATAWKNGYFLNNIASDFSDFVSRADAVGAKDIFIFKRTNGTWGFASKDSSFYNPKYLLIAATMSSDGTTANADPTKFIRFTDVAFSPYGRYGTYTAYVLNKVGDLGTTEGSCMVFPIPTGFSQPWEGEIAFYGSVASFPATGEDNVLYVSEADDTMHRWSASSYVPVGGGGGGGTVVSTDQYNEIIAGGDGGAYHVQDHNPLHSLYEAVGWESKMIEGVADNYSDIATFLDGETAWEIFAFRTVSGWHRIAVRNANLNMSLAGHKVTIIKNKYRPTETLEYPDHENFYEFRTTVNDGDHSGYTVFKYTLAASLGTIPANAGVTIVPKIKPEVAGTSYGEPEVIGTAREFERQQNSKQFSLADAATLNWDLNLYQSVRVYATGAVGASRTLPNSILTAAVDGGNYQMAFIQDGIGGRQITLDTNFVGIGAMDTRANQVTIITLTVQNGIGYVVFNSFEGLVSGLSNIGTGLVLLSGSSIKSLKAGTNIGLVNNGDDITINNSYSLTSGGAGNAVLVGSTIKSLVAGTDISITNTAGEITINSTASGGGATPHDKAYAEYARVSQFGDDGTATVNGSAFLTINAALTALNAYSASPKVIIIEDSGTHTYSGNMFFNTSLTIVSSSPDDTPTLNIGQISNLYADFNVHFQNGTLNFTGGDTLTTIYGNVNIEVNTLGVSGVQGGHVVNDGKTRIVAQTITETCTGFDQPLFTANGHGEFFVDNASITGNCVIATFNTFSKCVIGNSLTTTGAGSRNFIILAADGHMEWLNTTITCTSGTPAYTRYVWTNYRSKMTGMIESIALYNTCFQLGTDARIENLIIKNFDTSVVSPETTSVGLFALAPDDASSGQMIVIKDCTFHNMSVWLLQGAIGYSNIGDWIFIGFLGANYFNFESGVTSICDTTSVARVEVYGHIYSNKTFGSNIVVYGDATYPYKTNVIS
jgi:hypothetical protein